MLLIASVALVQLWRHQDRTETLDWTLLGTREGGRAIVVGFDGSYDGWCALRTHASASYRDGASNALELDVRVDTRGVCPRVRPQPGALFDPLVVRLERPLSGEAVEGAGRVLRPMSPTARLRFADAFDPPQVIGLNHGDANAVAHWFGYSLRLHAPTTLGRAAAEHHVRLGTNPVTRQQVRGRTLHVWFR